MKYLYKNTEIIVESGIELDSALFTKMANEKKPAKKPVTRKSRQTNKKG